MELHIAELTIRVKFELFKSKKYVWCFKLSIGLTNLWFQRLVKISDLSDSVG